MYSFSDKTLPGVAQPRASQTDAFAQHVQNKATQDFADPDKNVHEFGLRAGMKVADIGAGSGRYTKAMNRVIGTQGTVYAVEVQKDLLSKLETDMGVLGFHNIVYLWGNCEKIGGTKIPDSTVDCALLSNILFQVDDHASALGEMFRIVKPGGRLVVIDWTDSFGGLGPQPKSVFSKGEALAKAHAAGFEFVRAFDAGAHHYGLIFTRQK